MTTPHHPHYTMSPASTSDALTSNSTWDSISPGPELDYEILNNLSYLDDFDFNCDFTLFPTDNSWDSFDHTQLFPDIDYPPQQNKSQAAQFNRCSHCNATFSKRHELNRHLLKHTKPYTCNVPGCGASFAEKRGCDRHMKSRHGNPSTKGGSASVKCRFCKYSSTRPDAVQRHLRTQHGVQVSFKSGSSPATLSSDQPS